MANSIDGTAARDLVAEAAFVLAILWIGRHHWTRVLKSAFRREQDILDVIADDDMDEATRRDMEAYTGCIAGALTRGEFTAALTEAGLGDVEIAETHRVHEHAVSAIVRATKPR